jgi:sortase A
MRIFLSSILVSIGIACLTWWAADGAATAAFQREQKIAFDRALDRAKAPDKPVAAAPASVPSAIIVPPHGTIGRLEIPRVHLSAMILQGDDDATLARAIGHLPDTVMPWESGNSALAAHRDSFFRPLRNLREGDEIQVTTTDGPLSYRVKEIRITTPDDLEVLAPSSKPVLTLVTCYPFYYVGNAPKRYIVRAERITEE